jgi:hypothetical protein
MLGCRYELELHATGFTPVLFKDIQIQITETAKLDVRHALGADKQQIVVSGAPQLLQT